MAEPVNQQSEYDYQIPVKTEEYDYHVPAAKVVRPGFMQRFAQSFGIPTNSEEIVDSLKSTALNAVLPGLGPAVRSTVNYLQNASKAVKEGFGESAQAGRNVAEGGPLGANAGKAAFGGVHAAAGIVPIAGPMLESAGMDIGTGNIAGGAGTIAGMATQAALLGSPEVRAKAGKLSEKVPSPDLDIAYEKAGLGGKVFAQEHVAKLENEITKHVEPLIKTVDERNPQGVVNKAQTVGVLSDALDKYFPTITRAGFDFPNTVRLIVKELKNTPGDNLTMAEAHSLRSALGKAIAKVGDPTTKAPLFAVYGDLTDQMRAASNDVGMGKSFEQYNAVTRKLKSPGGRALQDAAEAQSGMEALKALNAQRGPVKMLLNEMTSYGVDPSKISSLLESYRETASPKAQKAFIDQWYARHAGAIATAAAGLGHLPGYGGVLALQALRTRGAAPPIPAEAAALGEQSALGRALPGPMEVPKPTPRPPAEPPRLMRQLPPGPQEPPIGGQAPPETSPPAFAAPEVPPEPVQAVAEVTPSKYEAAHAAVKDAGRRKAAITQLSGKKPTTDSMFAWVEKRTGLDMSDPANVPKALELLKAEEAEFQGKGKAESPKAPSKPVESAVNSYNLAQKPAEQQVPQQDVGAVGAAPAAPGASVNPPPETPRAEPVTPPPSAAPASPAGAAPASVAREKLTESRAKLAKGKKKKE
jgi:hypothetical protein